MADYSILKDAIADYVKDRTGIDTIDGDGLQETLLAMVNSLGAGYQYAGVAKLTPTQTDPGTPDQNVFYIAAEPGTYTNFPITGGYLQVAENEVAIFKYNGQWSKETTGAATAAQVTEFGQRLGDISIEPAGSGYIDASNGIVIDVSTYSVTDFISVSEGDIIKYYGYGGGSNVAAIAAYNSNNGYISALLVGTSSPLNTEVTIGSGVKKVRICFANSSHTQYVVPNIVIEHDRIGVLDKEVDALENGIVALSQKVEIKKPIDTIKNFVGVEITKGMISGQNKWSYIQDGYESYALKTRPGDSVKIVANDTYNCDLAFLKSISDNYQDGDVPDFSSTTGFTARIRVVAGNTQEFITPSDANYIVLVRLNNGNDHTPSDIQINGFSVKYDLRSFPEISSQVYKLQAGNITGLNKWGPLTNQSLIIALKPNAKIIITAGQYHSDLAFLRSIPSTYVEGGTPDFSTEVGFTARIRVSLETSVSFIVPSDANYLLVNVVNSGVNNQPAGITINGFDAYGDIHALVSQLMSSYGEKEVTQSIENSIVKEYMDRIIYDDGDYSYSFVDDYSGVTTLFRKDQPFPTKIKLPDIQGISSVKIGDNLGFSQVISISSETEIDVYNLIPGREYFAKCLDSSSNVLASFKFIPGGGLRMIKCDSLINIRDLGGWENLENKKVKYGKIIRGCTMEGNYPISNTDKAILLDVVKVSAELDLRTDAEAGYATESALGPSVDYVRIDPPRWEYFADDISDAVSKSVTMFRQVLSFLSAGKTIYTHCKGGADRTGCVALILEAALGLTESSMLKDYELTSFSSYGMRERDDVRADFPAHSFLPYIKANYQGSTLSEKLIAMLRSGGVTDSELATYKSIMLNP